MKNKKEVFVRPQTMGEEIANSISHGVGAMLAIAGTVIAIVYAALYGTAISVVSASLYGASLIILYMASTLYHSITNKTAKKVFQIFDHCSIFILILGSYIPICLTLLGGALGWTFFGINAGCTILGVVLNSIDMKKFKTFSMIAYIIMGWSVVFFFKPLIGKLDTNGLYLLVAGGIAYTVGVIFYKLKSIKYMHYIWHLCVLAGSAFQFFCILFYILPNK